MDPTCPWAEWAQMPARFCEASLCAWIRQPGNTWSNLGFIAVGAAVWVATRAPEWRHLRPMAWILVAMGLASGFFHASETAVGGWLDYASMYLSTAFMATVVLRRLFRIERIALIAAFWSIVAVGTSTMIVGGNFARGVFVVANLVCPIGEAALFARRSTRARSYRWFFAAYAAFAPAVVLWILDERRILCDPHDHVVSGHAAWHLLDAAMFGLSYLYYRQFEVLRVGKRPAVHR